MSLYLFKIIMYFLNTTTRFSNVNATEEVLKLLTTANNPNYSKIISLIKARLFEQDFYIYKNDEIPSILNDYITCIVTKNIHGIFNNKNEVPDEYKQLNIIESQSRYWWNLFNGNNRTYINSSTVIETSCKPEETLKYQNKKLDSGITISYQVNIKIEWNKILEDIISGKLDLSTIEFKKKDNYQQFINNRFHPPPSIYDFFTIERRAEISKLCILLGLEFPKNLDILNVTNLIKSLEQKLFLKNPVYKIDVKRKHNNSVDKKHTFKAEYTISATKTERNTLPKVLRNEKTYKYFVKLVGLIKGRLYNTFLPSVSASSLIIDKTGLAMFGEASKDVLSESLNILLMASMSYQKLFTIDSQMHGGIDKWLKAYLDLLISEHSTTTDFESIFRIIPSPRLISLIQKDKVENIYNYVLDWLKTLASVFEQQWKLGVDKCVKKGMMVPRRGTTEINVNAWNACAGAWGNLTRYIRLIDLYFNREPLQIFKVLKMTAGDQMQWADSAGKLVEPDCDIFKKLTLELNIMPWSGLFNSRDDYVQLITQTCETYKVESKKWLGSPKERNAENRRDVVSVCGVVINPKDVNLCKEAGAFGSKPFNSCE